ncbi:xanthine dehydrogenase family protein molybdopterin-binding subunit [Novosphingobium bradum]|uniref:Xanthine dehydrogenase family protein molybdopterin-binding subunit n=1 Tax=Novosphingobium bradum TaxID=1737444 RepID=A0ABV7IMV3_9SPHN
MNAPTGKLENAPAYRVVGTRPVRPDGVDKVTGKAIYSPDFAAAGMLHGAILRSPHAHARIRGIDTRAAAALPGVKAVVTAADFDDDATLLARDPSKNALRTARHSMARGKVLYDGHAVAAVAATSPDVAAAALALIVVDYEVLRPVMTLAEALAPDAPLVHEDYITPGTDPEVASPSNLALVTGNKRGDAAAAIAGADLVVERRFVMPPVHQGYIEPHACVAQWNADGQGQIWASSQGHFMIRGDVGTVLGIALADLRVVPLEIGGGFGGKTKVYLEPVAMLLSRKAGRPVRLAMSRSDVFRASGPAPGAEVRVRAGAMADGTIAGLEIDLAFLIGSDFQDEVNAGLASAALPYAIANFDFRGRGVFNTMPKSHAYRAPGAPQASYPVEAVLDEIAQALGLDPLELRLRNVARPGDTGYHGLPHGEVGFAEALEAAKAHPHWTAPLGEGEGRGVAAGAWGNYGGPSTAEVSVAEDGTVIVTEGSPDIGGSRAAMAMMAAETLGVPYDRVRVVIADTNSIGYSMLTGGSRTTFATGKAVVMAAEAVITQLRHRAAMTWGVEPEEVDWRDGAAWCGSGDNAGQSLTLPQIARRANFSGGPISANGTVNAQGWLPGIAVHICDAHVDRETGVTTITRYTAVQDVGTAIHPDYVEGQIQGGTVQGIGWALNEEYVWNAAGQVDNPGFLDYRMPVASDLPMIEAVMVEKPNPAHPYGVKGVGEAGIIPPLGAVGNAVSRAIGQRMTDLPLSPARVHAAICAG